MCFWRKSFSSIFNFCDQLWVEVEHSCYKWKIRVEFRVFGLDLNFITPRNQKKNTQGKKYSCFFFFWHLFQKLCSKCAGICNKVANTHILLFCSNSVGNQCHSVAYFKRILKQKGCCKQQIVVTMLLLLSVTDNITDFSFYKKPRNCIFNKTTRKHHELFYVWYFLLILYYQ